MKREQVAGYWEHQHTSVTDNEQLFADIEDNASYGPGVSSTSNIQPKKKNWALIIVAGLIGLSLILFIGVQLAISIDSATRTASKHSNTNANIVNVNTNDNDNNVNSATRSTNAGSTSSTTANTTSSSSVDSSYIKPVGGITPGIWTNNTILVGKGNIVLGQTTMGEFGLSATKYVPLLSSDYDRPINMAGGIDSITYTDELGGKSTGHPFTLQIKNMTNGPIIAEKGTITGFTMTATGTPKDEIILLDGVHLGDTLRSAVDLYGQPSDMSVNGQDITIKYMGDNSSLMLGASDGKILIISTFC